MTRGDKVRVGSNPHGPTFRYLKPWHRDARIVWLEVPFTGRVFKFPAVLLHAA